MAVVVTLIGKNKLTGPFGKGTRSLEGMGKALGRLGLRFAKFGALAGVAIGGVAIKLSIDLEKGLREVGTLMGGLADNEMKAMSKELRNVAVQSGQALDTLVKAKYDIVSAGFANAAESAQVLNASAMLATGGVTSVSNAADLLTTAINAYSKSAEDSVEISDKLFTVVRLGKTTMDALGSSMGRVLAIAGQAGISLDEVGAAVATLTAQGLDTARAVTSLQGAIVQILKPTELMKGIIQGLGFATGEALLKQKGFAESLKLVKARSDELNLPLSEVFGSIEALQAVMPLAGTAADAFAKNLDEMENSAGAAQKALEEMEQSASFQLSRVKQAFTSISIEIAEVFLPSIADAAKALADFLSGVTQQFANLKDAQIALGEAQAELAIRSDALSLAMRKGLPTAAFLSAYEKQAEVVAKIERAVTALFPKMTLLTDAQIEQERITKALNANIPGIVQGQIDMRISTEGLTEELRKLKIGFDRLVDGGKQIIDIAPLISTAFNKAFDPSATIGDAFKIFIINILDLIQGVILAAAAMNQALTFAFVPIVGTAGVIAALAGLELAKAGVRAIDFEHGGVVPSFAHGGVVPINAHAGEIISTQKAANLFGPEITRMNQIAEGLGGGG